jgi:predicted RNA-binding protein Jag
VVDFVQLQQIVKEQLDQDRSISAVEARGPTLEEAVAQAATLLNLSVRRLEYEVAERGSAGFMGAGKKDWKIRAYQRLSVQEEIAEDDEAEDGYEYDVPVVEDRDGEVFTQLRYEGAFLKVSLPQGSGKRATLAQAQAALE